MDASRLLEVLLDVESEFEDGLACDEGANPAKEWYWYTCLPASGFSPSKRCGAYWPD